MMTTSEQPVTEYEQHPTTPFSANPAASGSIKSGSTYRLKVLLIVTVICGGIAFVFTQFEKGYRSHRQEYASTTTTTPAIAAETTSNKDDPPAVAAKERRLAPDGVFFVTERTTLKTKSGVVSFAPGTSVRLVSKNGDTFRVTDGTTTMDVSRNHLTDDLHLAEIVAQDDYATQQAVAAYIGNQVEVHRQQIIDQGAQYERYMQQFEARRQEARRLAKENTITAAEADILNLRDVHRDISGNIIYGHAVDGISVGPGQARSFREQAELVKQHRLPELTTEERRQRWREDYTYTQQHKTPDVIVVH